MTTKSQKVCENGWVDRARKVHYITLNIKQKIEFSLKRQTGTENIQIGYKLVSVFFRTEGKIDFLQMKIVTKTVSGPKRNQKII